MLRSNENLHPLLFFQKFICRKTGSKDIAIRDWALKCCATFSMKYKQISLEVFEYMCKQLYQHQNTRIWCTSICSICELFAYYGIEYFESNNENECQDISLMIEKPTINSSTINLLNHIFDHCEANCIRAAIAKGFGQLVMSKQYNISMIKLIMLEYFNTSPDASINQILGIFFQSLIRKKRQYCLQEALFQTVYQIIDSSEGRYGFQPETVIKFVVNSTIPADRRSKANVHNELAFTFLKAMDEKSSEPELLKIISKQFLQLEIGDTIELKEKLENEINKLLSNNNISENTVVKNLKLFRQKLDLNRSGDSNLSTDNTSRRSPADGNISSNDDSFQAQSGGGSEVFEKSGTGIEHNSIGNDYSTQLEYSASSSKNTPDDSEENSELEINKQVKHNWKFLSTTKK